ncbi:hypothetical protein WMY93_014874 [Mugilogobius chulae]|uniref:NAD(P)(+)--arginine ADP-ribosyltransferase n=1 Tax=Mugilogobius chulae TaxID=88201 RepID=A0AAW0P7T8_9GOBI
MKSTKLTGIISLVILMPMASKADTIELTLELNSVDDKYEVDGCVKEMTAAVDKYLEYDMLRNDLFKERWGMAESKANELYETRKNAQLTKLQIQALLVYTGDEIYEPFKAAIQNGKANYLTKTFEYYALHFLLASALQTIKADDSTKCYTTYRGTKHTYKGNVGDEMRFGYFASSSTSSQTAGGFGKSTCFHILTCFGALIEDYANLPYEKEVLIPPYEKFQIKKRAEKGSINTEELKGCEIMFELESKGKMNTLDCKAPAIEGTDILEVRLKKLKAKI